MWWKDGKLYIDCYIFNDSDSSHTLSSTAWVKAWSSNGYRIAEGNFDLSKITLGPKEHLFWRLEFNADIYYATYGSSLAGYLQCDLI
jgi:hypothetical protein